MMLKKLICLLFGQKNATPIRIEDVTSILLKPIGTAIGDSIVHLAHLRQLKMAFPHIKIGVLVTERCKAIYETSGVVDELLNDVPRSYIKEREKWDLYLDFQPTFTSKSIILDAILLPKWSINFGKNQKKHYNLQTVKNYDESVTVPERTHFKDYLKYTSFAKSLTHEAVYKLPEFATEKTFWQSSNQVRVLLNPQGSTRSLPSEELDLLLSEVKVANVEFLMTNTQGSEAYFHQLTPRTNLYLAPKIALFEYFALVESADIVVSVDGGGVHIACAYQKPLLSFYSNNEYTFYKWAPAPYEGVESITLMGKEQANDNNGTSGFDMVKAADWLKQQIAFISK